MSQFETLSVAGRTLVDNYLSGSVFSVFRKKEQLIVSLYAALKEARPEVTDILKSYIFDLGKFFSVEEIHLLQKECTAVIRYCHERKDQDMGEVRSSDNHPLMIPESLLELCDKLLEVHEGSDVFLPYSATSQLAFLKSNCRFQGFEINPEIWAFTQIYLYCYGIDSDIQLTGDLHQALPKGKKYDYVFSFPPFLMGREGRKVIDSLYHLATHALKDDGTMCCILPSNFCTATSGWFDLRKILLEYHNKYSAAVISLPKMLYPYTSIETCLFILSKDSQGKVLLMDASSEFFCARHDVDGSKEFELKVQSVIECFTRVDEKYVWGGFISDLVGDVNLQPSRYLVSQILPQAGKSEEAKSLFDLIEVVQLQRDERIRAVVSQRNRIAHSSSADITQKETEEILSQYRELEKNAYPLIGMKELSFSYLNCDINREGLPFSKKVEYQVLTEDCLLIGFIGGKFKVGRLHGVSQEAPVCLRHEIIPVRVASDIITDDFFLRSIMSEPVQKQAQMMASGVSISRITKQDLLSIVINVPKSKEQQELLMKEDTRSSLTEADRKIIQSYEDFRKDMHMKKHAIGQTLFNLNNWWDALQQARIEGNGVVSDDATTGKIRKVSVASIYDSIQKAINQLQQQINKFDRGNGLAVKKFALTEFIEDYISRKQSPLFSFFYDKSMHHASKTLPEVEYNETTGEYRETGNIILNEGDPIEYVEFAPDALEIVFDNIVSNACCHGFKDRTNNVVKIELKSEGDNFVIIISNNGSAIHAQIKPEEVFVYGKTSKMGRSGDKDETHFGIGGYEVQKLMREFGGDAEFISDTESDFPVSYKLTFYNSNFESIEL